ncbi:formylglycine-generating enzyme family protein [Roseibium sediminis]|uniref:formylglycine-generating enzyme family protein n=1 Tax=Roseibium sediminis TaxID=1775174 RepID=UPI00123D8611|nr:SUMF1/EgtB/PvdO family nonheme iron enzyme [Roseibium sediminis]
MGLFANSSVLARGFLVFLLAGASGYAAGPLLTGLGTAADMPPSGFVAVDVGDDQPLLVQKHQVTTSDWLACVDDGGCPDVPLKSDTAGPVYGINVLDAQSYIRWKSALDGRPYRLPTHEEWMLLAADQVPEESEALFLEPEMRWAADFRMSQPNPVLAEPNLFGIEQLRDTVWEWTGSCARMGDEVSGNCDSLRIAMGNHMALLSIYARDTAKAGCGGGTPPARVGFRLVLEAGA